MMRITGGPGRLMLFLGSCVLIAIVISGLACRKKAPSASETGAVEPEPNAPKPVAVEPQIDKTVATVNGKTVTERELNRRVALAVQQVISRQGNRSPQYAEQMKKMARAPVLDNLIVERLLDEQVATAGIKITDAEVLAEIAKTGAQQKPPMTVEQFKTAVEAQGSNFEDAKNDFARGMGYMKLMEPTLSEAVKVSDEEAKQYYDSHLTNFAIPEQIRASHILAKTQSDDPNTDPNQAKAAAKEKIEKLYKHVKDGGDFAVIARENSEDSGSASKGGDLGFFSRGQMVSPFEQAAFAMKVGDISGIVESQFGYHIIKVTDHKDAGTTPFEEVKAQIVEGLAKQKRQAAIRQYVQALKEKAKIEYAPGEGPAPKPVAPTPPQVSQPAVSPAPATASATQPTVTPAPAPEPNAAKP
jgi:peptidyl-prolyl cis-trans isomerase C